ncbi:hypothetical protein AVEN_194231-1 [Araneus ventricosus]|uniref:Uncharacterized protein n=1 Tax=Araneus ventricosus TaxID=182803 RepID=A0A4Y2HGK7_ARAVE|nr:hypothetical protein AVEN_194231-1 [Araneus ventricosus]
MLFGRTLPMLCDILFGRPSDTPSSPNEYLNSLEARLESVHAFARERIKLASERIKTRYNTGATDHHFEEVIKSGCIPQSDGGVCGIIAASGNILNCNYMQIGFALFVMSPIDQ